MPVIQNNNALNADFSHLSANQEQNHMPFVEACHTLTNLLHLPFDMELPAISWGGNPNVILAKDWLFSNLKFLPLNDQLKNLLSHGIDLLFLGNTETAHYNPILKMGSFTFTIQRGFVA